jgi:lipoprotein-releasing system permease protein
MKYETAVALRYLRSKRKDKFISFTTWISVVGIAIGVMALIVVIAVMTGFQNEIRDRILGINPHILVVSLGGEIYQPQKIVEAVREIPGVASASPFSTFQAMAQTGRRITGVVVKGITSQDLASMSRILKGGAGTFDGRDSILLGKELSRELGIVRGDRFSLLVPFAGFSPMGAVPETVRVQAAGIFETGMYEIDNTLMLMPIEDVQRIVGGGVTGVEVKLKDVYQADAVRKLIAKKLGPGFFCRTWMEMNKNLFSALKLEKIAMFIILALVIFVASFNIISSLVMTVMEKKKDIAILKAMGARNNSIMRIFMAEGLAIGVFGALVGALIGYGLCEVQTHYKIIKLPPDVYYISSLPMTISLPDVLLIAAVTILLCLLSTLYPSFKATTIDPVETLRYE